MRTRGNAALDPAQVQQYLATFDQTELGAAVATAIGSGCRRGELLALRWCDLDLGASTLRVARSLERVTIRTAKRVRYELRFKEPKTKRSRRTVALPPFVADRLRRHRPEQAQRLMAAGFGRPDRDTLVFERDGEPWNPNTFGTAFARIASEANLPKVRLHDLRHPLHRCSWLAARTSRLFRAHSGIPPSPSPPTPMRTFRLRCSTAPRTYLTG
jgi:integrase